MARRIKSIWDEDLDINDEVKFETFAGNTVRGTVTRFGVDPALVYVRTWDRGEECFGRVVNISPNSLRRANEEHHWAVPPVPKFTPQEILDRFLLEGGDTNAPEDQARPGTPRP